MKYILKNKMLSIEYLLNVNFPLGDRVDKIVLTNIHYRPHVTYYISDGNDHYHAWRDIKDEDCDEIGSDVYAVYHHQISITKINKTGIYKE